MFGARGLPIYAVLVSAITGLILLSSFGTSNPVLPSNWEAKYFNLKDDIRTLAIDPLDPRVVYIGTDQAIISTSDGGDNWTSGKSFRIDKVDLSSVLTEEALQAALLTNGVTGEEDLERIKKVSEEKEADREEREEALVRSKSEQKTAEESQANIASRLGELETQLAQTKNDLTLAEGALSQAQSALATWQPDPLTVAEVEGLPYESNDTMESSAYEGLEQWLIARGLSVPVDPHERQNILVNYLKEHAALGVALPDMVIEAEEAVANAEANVDSYQAQITQLQENNRASEEIQEKPPSDQPDEEDSPAKSDLPNEEGDSLSERLENDITGVTHIAIDPSNPDNVFLATFNGIYRSTDKGKNWTRIYSGANPSQSAALYLAIDPSDPNNIFAGTLSGLVRSTDGGQTWERPAGRISDKVVTVLAVHPFDSKVVLAGTQGKGVFRSYDGGSTWIQSFSRPSAQANNVRALKFAPSQPTTLYCGTENGIFKSADGGDSWETVGGMGLGTARIQDLLVLPNNPEVVYLATERGVFGTENGGKEWRRLTFGPDFRGSKYLTLDPLNPDKIWLITDDRVYENVPPLTIDLSTDLKATLSGNCEVILSGSERHCLMISDVDEEKGVVTIEIQSDPQSVELKKGESAPVDLDQDGEVDMVVTLDEISDGVPTFTLERSDSVEGKKKTVKLKRVEEMRGLEDLEPYFAAEPTWVEVQQAASRWAEVHPDKIAAWRRGASLRAFLPEIRLEFTLDRGWSTNERQEHDDRHQEDNRVKEQLRQRTKDKTETYYKTQYTSGLYIFEDRYTTLDQDEFRDIEQVEYGVEDKVEDSLDTSSSYDRRRDYSLRLEWELGDFLYNREMLRVSDEARDLVELRQDVLEQVTLYFFDRRTARIDMIMNPPADPYSRVEMLLRIQQLDASLDALTGGYFTQTIKERAKELPSSVSEVSFIRTY